MNHQEKGEPGACKVARYHGPMVLELKPKLPGCPQASAARFKVRLSTQQLWCCQHYKVASECTYIATGRGLRCHYIGTLGCQPFAPSLHGLLCDTRYLSSMCAQTAEPAAPFAPLWPQRGLQGDLQVLAADGSAEPAHRSVLQCRMPPLQTQQLPTAVQHVRISAITDRATLLAFLEFVYLDEVAPAHITHHLHLAALRCAADAVLAGAVPRDALQLDCFK